jgi:phosphoribosylamine--glycine ligase/phosphoribosylformylglycinamidine cyclo-ligase
LIPETTEEALEGLKSIMVNKEFGSAGDEVVVEEYLEGEELSFLAFSDGYTVIPLPPAQDHKRALDGDLGPNTGGMGCYAPTPIGTKDLIDEVKRTVLQPTIDGMRRDGYPFVGMLFTGIMLTATGPKVLEYNVRFGDPETEVVLPLLSDDTDLAEVMLACAEGRLDAVHIGIKQAYAATVVLASGGYPGNYEKGKEITIGATPKGKKHNAAHLPSTTHCLTFCILRCHGIPRWYCHEGCKTCYCWWTCLGCVCCRTYSSSGCR